MVGWEGGAPARTVHAPPACSPRATALSRPSARSASRIPASRLAAFRRCPAGGRTPERVGEDRGAKELLEEEDVIRATFEGGEELLAPRVEVRGGGLCVRHPRGVGAPIEGDVLLERLQDGAGHARQGLIRLAMGDGQQVAECIGAAHVEPVLDRVGLTGPRPRAYGEAVPLPQAHVEHRLDTHAADLNEDAHPGVADAIVARLATGGAHVVDREIHVAGEDHRVEGAHDGVGACGAALLRAALVRGDQRGWRSVGHHSRARHSEQQPNACVRGRRRVCVSRAGIVDEHAPALGLGQPSGDGASGHHDATGATWKTSASRAASSAGTPRATSSVTSAGTGPSNSSGSTRATTDHLPEEAFAAASRGED